MSQFVWIPHSVNRRASIPFELEGRHLGDFAIDANQKPWLSGDGHEVDGELNGGANADVRTYQKTRDAISTTDDG